MTSAHTNTAQSDSAGSDPCRIGPAHHPVAKGYLVHCVTASGAICGMFGLIAVADYKPKAAVLWLAVAMVLDGIDGPVARAWSVRETVPRIDGYALDLIIDYVTCIVIPVLFLHRFDMLPQGWSLYIGAFMLFTSALWMSRTDQMTEDHFFNGFPCEWNMIVPTLYLLNANKWFVTGACLVLALTQLTNIKFLHPMQVKLLRPLTVGVTVVWLASVLFMIAERPATPMFGTILLIACPCYIVGIGVWRTLAPESAMRFTRATANTPA
ncbi:MAG: CDP-alcohol phosphatidyltransferase family protein [Ilumatobacteraceae bacterium]